MKDYIFELPMKVRSYECDFESIVNNAVYQNYLEHTRHEFLIAHGLDVVELHRQGIDTVVARINIAFKSSLHDNEEFLSKLNVKKEGLKYVFYQDIYRKKDEKLIIKATVDIVCIINGKLGNSDIIDNLFAEYLQ
ncbi:MAG: acyl-CoA thioesterase [Bacteroidales bacterium]|nr:acyl-CoA thioesterase [Bacteroidales bacterium]